MIREQAATEARLLRASADEPAYRRRDLLDDLVTRLDALWLHVKPSGQVAKQVAATLRELIALLREDRRTMAERWARALTLLDELAAEPAAAPRQFWKRS